MPPTCEKFNDVIAVAVKMFHYPYPRALHNHHFKRGTKVCSLVAIISLEFTHEKTTARRIPAVEYTRSRELQRR